MGGFKDFLTKSNALALAIGIILGVALGGVVNSLVNDIIMPPIGWALGGVDFGAMQIVLGTAKDGSTVAIKYGAFINTVIIFLVVALVVYWIGKLVIREAPPPGPTAEETLLTEIRDELRKRSV
jgi:large conductance mechanosensitive channel